MEPHIEQAEHTGLALTEPARDLRTQQSDSLSSDRWRENICLFTHLS